MAVLTTLSS